MAFSDRLLVFTVSRQYCALALSDVEKVFPAVAVNPLPDAPAIVSGLINLQGQIIPVLNIRRLFQSTETAPALSDQMIIAHTSKRTLAILVDGTEGVVDYEHKDIAFAEELYPNIGYLKGAVKLKDGVTFIYDLNKFLSIDEEAALDRLVSPATRPFEVDGHE